MVSTLKRKYCQYITRSLTLAPQSGTILNSLWRLLCLLYISAFIRYFKNFQPLKFKKSRLYLSKYIRTINLLQIDPFQSSFCHKSITFFQSWKKNSFYCSRLSRNVWIIIIKFKCTSRNNPLKSVIGCYSWPCPWDKCMDVQDPVPSWQADAVWQQYRTTWHSWIY